MDAEQRRHANRRRRRSSTRLLKIEPLESRRLLATFSVTNLDDAGVGSLRQAILDANTMEGADTIDFAAGLFVTPQTLPLSTALPTITEDLTIVGPGQELLTINAGNGADTQPGTGDGFRLFNIDDGIGNSLSSTSISGVTLTGGDVTGEGGAILNRENLTITDVAIVSNATGPGDVGGTVEAGQNGSDGERGGNGGGIFSVNGDLTIVQSTISGNSTGGGGTGGTGGDGIDGGDGGNGGYGGNGGDGGGIYFDTIAGELMIVDSTISNNSTGNGGLGGNPGLGDGGGSEGNGGDGGSAGDGGGILSFGGNITILRSTISGNFTGVGSDGAVGFDGGFGGDGGDGGGLYGLVDRLAISQSTITDNRTGEGGAGGNGSNGGSNGSSGADGRGGGVFSNTNDPVPIDNSIIAANQAAGAVPDLKTGNVTLTIDFSLIGDGDGLVITSGTGNQIGTGLVPIDPELGPLADNGGPTQTHAPLVGSPVIDAGDPSILPNPSEFDQRGTPFQRVRNGDQVAGAVIDIGAVEVHPPPSADFDQDNDVDGTDFLAWQRGFGTTTGAQRADGDSDDDGDVDADDLSVWQNTYGQSTPPPTAAATAPEDSAMILDLALTSLAKADETESVDDGVSPEGLVVDGGLIFSGEQSEQQSAATKSDGAAAPAIDDGESTDADARLHDELITTLF